MKYPWAGPLDPLFRRRPRRLCEVPTRVRLPEAPPSQQRPDARPSLIAYQRAGGVAVQFQWPSRVGY